MPRRRYERQPLDAHWRLMKLALIGLPFVLLGLLLEWLGCIPPIE